jgi:hypothetical protein
VQMRVLIAEGQILVWGEDRKVGRTRDELEMLSKQKDWLGRHLCCDAFGIVSDKRLGLGCEQSDWTHVRCRGSTKLSV